MDRAIFLQDVQDKVKDLKELGFSVEINDCLPTLAINFDHDGMHQDYFFQEQNASEIIDATPDDMTREEYILWTYVDYLDFQY